MRTYRTAMVAALLVSCTACADSHDDGIKFCDASGKVAYVSVDEATGVLWLSDMGLEQMLECGGEDLCFLPARKRFIVSQAVDGPVRRRNEFDWGHIEWQLDPATRELVLILDNQATKRRDVLRSCEPVPIEVS